MVTQGRIWELQEPGTDNIFRGDVTIGEGQMGNTTEASLPYNHVIFIETTVSPEIFRLEWV